MAILYSDYTKPLNGVAIQYQHQSTLIYFSHILPQTSRTQKTSNKTHKIIAALNVYKKDI